EDDAERPSNDSRAIGRGRDLDRHLHRPGRTPRPLRPHRRPLARPRGRRRRERPERPPRDRRADGRREGLVTDAAAAVTLREPPPRETAGRQAIGAVTDFLLRSILPLVLALGAGAIILAVIGVDPIQYYEDIWSGGFEFAAWQDTAMRVAPLLLIA